MSSSTNTLFSSEHEVEVIAGHMYDIPYEVYSQDGIPVDLQIPGVIIQWRLSPFGYKNMPLISKTNANTEIEIDENETNVFTVHVLSSDTDNLDGIYTCQVTIIDPGGYVSRPYEGQTIIRSRIPN